MFASDQTIPCPTCAELGKDSKISFQTSQLLLGVRFGCPVCQSEVGLAPESKPLVQKTMEELDLLKKKLGM
jgi:transcription initiation factor IIE alpha subunit